MSALHRNALLDDEAVCLRCAEPVELPADYCAACAPPTLTARLLNISERTAAILMLAIALVTAIAIWRL